MTQPSLHSASEQPWFKAWFNSPYYHILYKNRDHREAEDFLDNLIKYLNPAPESRILDVGCGRGRHSIYLNRKGFDVTGFDLSHQNIAHDKLFENEKLNFFIHDMRELFRINYFDLTLNLFSSFGYFEKDHDNVRCLISVANGLKPKGKFVLDYFNSSKIKKTGELVFERTIGHVKFHIRKTVIGNIIRKEINFKDGGREFSFEEKVHLLEKPELEKYFKKAGLNIISAFGNYQLEPFNELNSDRLILIATKAADQF